MEHAQHPSEAVMSTTNNGASENEGSNVQSFQFSPMKKIFLTVPMDHEESHGRKSMEQKPSTTGSGSN